MAVPRIGPDSKREASVSYHGPIFDWQSAVAANLEMRELFDSMDEEAQALIEWRMSLQRETHEAQLNIATAKSAFDRRVEASINGELADVDELEALAKNQSEAYRRCVEVTAEILQVETMLFNRGLRSEPFLWLTQRRDGQAMVSYPGEDDDKRQESSLYNPRTNRALAEVAILRAS